MTPLDMQTRPLDPTAIEFLEDWRDDHRPLGGQERARAGRYIGQIVARETDRHDRVAGDLRAVQLWVQFREIYDGFRGPFGRSDAEDFVRAMSRI